MTKMDSVQSLRALSHLRRALSAIGVGVLAAAMVLFATPSYATVVAAEPIAPPVSTTTSLEVITVPAQYGSGPSIVMATVALDGPSNLSGQQVTILLDGVVVGSAPLVYTGSGTFIGFFGFSNFIPAGTHELSARFDGYAPDTGQGAAPSTSAPVTVTVAKAPTTTEIVSAPASVSAFQPIDVHARVAPATAELDGTATLFADAALLATVTLGANGEAMFNDVVVPMGAIGLSVVYNGDSAGNYASSTSLASPISVTAVETSTDLRLSASEAWADETVTATVDVVTLPAQLGAPQVDARGEIEVFVDGAVVASALLPVAAPATGTVSVQVPLSAADIAIGDHDVSARFVPEIGFQPSASADLGLRVKAIDTSVRPLQQSVTGTPSHPASVEVEVVEVRDASPAAPAATGTVQAFIGGDPFGDPIALVAGAATVPFAGLAVGSYDVELRFTPDMADRLPSSALVDVVVTADIVPPVPTPDAAPAEHGSAKLPATGLSGSDAWGALGIGVVLLGLGAMLIAVRRRRA
ncbi:Ig-like domain-containing protein [Microbacterium sp. A196]|uniref:Ig-like domain-containing protein n=1 Tax=Microbacterium sp. A196 TaxID=3457320 RepID=UPI003FD2420C